MYFSITSNKGLSILLFLGAFLLYGNTILNDYNLDDELVTNNHRLTSKGITAIPEIFTSFYYEDDMGYTYGFRPITHLTFAIEHALFGENPHFSHAFNVLLFALSCVLIFLLMGKMLPYKSTYLSLLIAVIFCIHPIHTEVVASIKNRDELLALFFGLSSLIVVFRWGSSENLMKSILVWFTALGLFGLSILSKKSGVFLSFTLPILHLIFTKKKSYLWLSVLFSVLANLMVIFLLGLTTLPAFILIVGSLSIILGIHLTYKNKWATFFDKMRLIIQDKSFVFVAFSLAVVIFCVGLFLKEMSLVALAIIFIISSAITSSYAKIKSLIALVIWALSCIATVYLQHKEFLFIGYFLGLLLGRPVLKKYKIIGLLIPLISIIALYFLKQDSIFPYLVVFISFLYLGSLIFDPFLLIIAGIMVFSSIWGVFSIPLAILLLVIWLLTTNLKFVQERIMFKNSNPYLIILVGVVLGISYMQDSFYYSPSVKAQVQIEDKEDRPILAVENPMIENWSLENRFATALTSLQFYTTKLLFPYPLSFYYGYDQIKILTPQSDQFCIACVMFLLVILLILFMLYKWFKTTLFIALGFLFLIPYSNLFVPVAGIVGERLAYFASLWFCTALGLIIFRLNQNILGKKRSLAYGAIGILFIASIALVLQRNFLWKDKITLFEHDVKDVNQSAQAHALLAYAYLEHSNEVSDPSNNQVLDTKAIASFNKAISIYPFFLNWWYDKGLLEEKLGKYEEGIASFKKVLEIDPIFESDLLLKIAAMELETGKFSNAAASLMRLKKSGFTGSELYNSMAFAYVQLNQMELAESILKEGIILHPNNYDLKLNLGKLYYQFGINELALSYFKQAQEIDASDPQLSNVIQELSSLDDN